MAYSACCGSHIVAASDLVLNPSAGDADTEDVRDKDVADLGEVAEKGQIHSVAIVDCNTRLVR